MIYEKSAGFSKEVHRSRQLAVHFVVALSVLSAVRSTQTRFSVKWGVLGAQYYESDGNSVLSYLASVTKIFCSDLALLVTIVCKQLVLFAKPGVLRFVIETVFK